MTTSGTYAFGDLGTGSLTIQAFQMCGVRPAELIQEHMESARMALNMMSGRWSSQGVNLWTVDLQTVPLVAGTTTYSVPTNTVAMLDAYTTTGSGDTATNRIILPVSRTEYASYPNPQQEGSVTTFWFDRLLSPTVSLYYTPDGTQASFSYYRIRQIQDAGFTNGQTVELPYYWLESAAFGLAARLAVIWAPDRAAGLKALADEAWAIAAAQNVETASFSALPQIGGYYRP